MSRVTGLWVYQTLGRRPNPDTVAALAKRRGLKWLTAQAIEGDDVLDHDWLRKMRRANAACVSASTVHRTTEPKAGRRGPSDGQGDRHPRCRLRDRKRGN